MAKQPARAEHPTSEPALTPARRLAFWALTLALPLLFFVLLEGGLRLGGYGASYPMFEQVEGYPEYLAQSRDLARRYFHRTREAPTGLHDVFHAQKRDGELRLFVQGGSSAAGFPFYHGAAFSRMLGARLQEALPERPVSVVNTGMAAVNSFTLLDLAPDILRQQPDAVLLYAGHNEYYGAFGVGSTESLGASRALVNTYLRLKDVRTVQLVRSGLERVASLAPASAAEQPSGSLMARMVGQQSIPYGSRDYRRGLRQFEGNLRDLLRTYRRAGVPVFVATLVYNERDHPPFVTVFEDGTDQQRWRADYQAARRALDAGDAVGAVALFEELTRSDTLAADGFYGLGQAYEAAGDTAAALAAYRAASDRDALRFRAPSAFNDVIRRVASEEGATVVDVEERFRRAARGGIIGSAEMLEHLHPTVDGYFLIADAFYDSLVESPLLSGVALRAVPAEVARSRVRLTPADSLAGVLRVRLLMASWPFQPLDAPRPRAEEMLPADSPEARIALEAYAGRKNWLEATEDLALELERAGRVAEAVRTREAMLQSYPMLSEPPLGMAALYMRAGELDQAAHYLRLSIERGERSGNAHGLLGAIELQRGVLAADAGDHTTSAERLARAVRTLEQARHLNPRNPQTLYNLSGAYAKLDRFDEARTTAEALLRLQPNHQAGQQLLASLPEL